MVTLATIVLMDFHFVVPGAPTALKATIVEKTNVRLTWNPPTNTNGVLLDYQIVYYGFKEQQTVDVRCCTYMYAKTLIMLTAECT